MEQILDLDIVGVTSSILVPPAIFSPVRVASTIGGTLSSVAIVIDWKTREFVCAAAAGREV
jgi:hypothetical protein